MVCLFILLAPTGSPSITMTSSSMIGEIYIEWSLIPEPQRNGLITHYVIQYSNSTITLNETVNGGTTTNVSSIVVNDQ